MEEKTKTKNIILVIIVIIFMVAALVGGFCLGNKYYEYEETKNTEKEKNEEVEETNKEEEKEEEKEEIPSKEEKIQIVGIQYEEFDKMVKNIASKKSIKIVKNYESFHMNAVHSTEPGGWGDGLPEMYYFDEDGTYVLNISQYDVSNKEVLRAGTWEIKNDQLILKEKYVLCKVNGKEADVNVPGGSTAKGYIDYDFEVKETSKTTTYTIKHIGLSEYKEAMYEDQEYATEIKIDPDHYTLNGKDHYSLTEGYGIYDLDYAYMYYNLIK